MNTTLQAFLDANVEWVEKAARKLPPGGDLVPQLSWVDNTGTLGILPVDMTDKDAAAALMRAMLREFEAERYALITAGWMVSVKGEEGEAARRIVEEHGTGHPAYRSRRVEIYLVSAGDKNETLTAVLDVTRDRHGKIVRLTRRPQGMGMAHGRMLDLLAEARH